MAKRREMITVANEAVEKYQAWFRKATEEERLGLLSKKTMRKSKRIIRNAARGRALLRAAEVAVGRLNNHHS